MKIFCLYNKRGLSGSLCTVWCRCLSFLFFADWILKRLFLNRSRCIRGWSGLHITVWILPHCFQFLLILLNFFYRNGSNGGLVGLQGSMGVWITSSFFGVIGSSAIVGVISSRSIYFHWMKLFWCLVLPYVEAVLPRSLSWNMPFMYRLF